MNLKHKSVLIISLVLFVGILASGLSGWSLYRTDEKAIINDFRKDVDERAASFYREVTINLETLYSLSVMFSEGNLPSLPQFSVEAKKILNRHDDIKALEWIPRVSHSDRLAYEKENRHYFPNFQFTERESQGHMVKAKDRSEYYPVYYVEPVKGNEAAIGFDLASNSVRRETLEKSIRNARPLATASIKLVQENETQKGFLVFLPIYKGNPSTVAEYHLNFRGFILGVFRIGDIFRNSVLSEHPMGINMILRDETSDSDYDTLNFHISRTGIPANESIVYKKYLPDISGRKWSITAKPTISYISVRRSRLPVVVFFTGIILTLIMSLYIRFISRQTAIIKQNVVERTQRLSEVNLKLVKTQKELKIEQERTKELLEMRTEELRETQLQLFQAEKMDTIGKLSAGIAHEVKNPLAVIQLGINYFQKSLHKDEDIDGIIQDMDNAVHRADSVIKELVDFSASRQLKLEKQELNPVIGESLLLVNHELTKHNINVEMRLEENLPFIEIDRNKLQQVFINVLMNAINAMGSKGTLLIRTYTGELKNEIKKHNLSSTGQFRLTNNIVVIEIEDTGPGINPEDENKIFEPFFTTKKAGVGTGLGLTVTENIVRLHNAYIDIKNRKEGGVIVTIIFKAT